MSTVQFSASGVALAAPQPVRRPTSTAGIKHYTAAAFSVEEQPSTKRVKRAAEQQFAAFVTPTAQMHNVARLEYLQYSGKQC